MYSFFESSSENGPVSFSSIKSQLTPIIMEPIAVSLTINDLTLAMRFDNQFGHSALIKLCRSIENEMKTRPNVKTMSLIFEGTPTLVGGCTCVYRIVLVFQFHTDDGEYRFPILIGRYDEMRPGSGYEFFIKHNETLKDYFFSLFASETTRKVCCIVDSQLSLVLAALSKKVRLPVHVLD